VVVGTSALDAFTPNLLTPALARASHGRAGTRLRLWTLEAIRYTGVSVPGRPADAVVYAFATDRRVIYVACLPAQAAAAVFLAACERIASTARPLNGYPVPLVSATDYADALASALAGLDLRRAKAHGRLVRATTRSAQAAAASALASAYAVARRAVAKLAPRPELRSQHAALVNDLRATARSYGLLARAATRGTEGAWRAARGTTIANEARTARDAAALRTVVILPGG